LKGRYHFKHPGIDRRIILMNLKGKGGRMWTGFIWLRIGSVGGLF
jgi:hypothetical protein